MGRKKGILWTVITILLAIISVILVIKQASGNYSFSELYRVLRSANQKWLTLAFISSLGFIYFEGRALLTILKGSGYKKNELQGILFGAADNYFSAITPSASGGQPVCAFFMILTGVPGSVVTAVILLNLVLYTLAIIASGLVAVCIWPEVVFAFDPFSYCFILLGCGVLIGLAFGFYMILKNRRVLEKIINAILGFLTRIHIMRNSEERKERLKEYMDEYEIAVHMMTGHRKYVIRAFFYNLFQRFSQILVTFFVYLAVGGKIWEGIPLISIQTFVSIGSYSVPIPGGMGVVDYLMLNGFQSVLSKAEAVQLELISRGISFYICAVLSGIAVAIGYYIYAKDIYAKH